MYHLPLLPGYGSGVNVRSSVPPEDRLTRMSEAEENGYQGTYFTSTSPGPSFSLRDGYIKSASPEESRKIRNREGEDTEVEAQGLDTETEQEPLLGDGKRKQVVDPVVEDEPALQRSESDTVTIHPSETQESDLDRIAAAEREHQQSQEGNVAVRDYVDAAVREERQTEREREREDRADSVNVAEVVFFAYGVVVFFGLEEGQERSILEDVEGAGVMRRKMGEEQWELEECHYAVSSYSLLLRYGFGDGVNMRIVRLQYDHTIQYPRIYNDFFSTCTACNVSLFSVVANHATH